MAGSKETILSMTSLGTNSKVGGDLLVVLFWGGTDSLVLAETLEN